MIPEQTWCPLPRDAPSSDRTGNNEKMIAALEHLDSEEMEQRGWSASARHFPELDCITVIISTGGDSIDPEVLEQYRQDMEDSIDVTRVDVVQSDQEPDSLD